jgi:uncharacterized repeat protein (TIGR01451 family)
VVGVRKLRLPALAALIVLAALVVAPIAAAHHPIISASIACDGTVTYTVVADELDASRDNPDIAVTDTSGLPQPIANGVFNAANGWSFSGSFVLPAGDQSDTLTATPLGVWGDGDYDPTNTTSVTVTRPPACPSTITTQLSASSITVGGSVHDSASLSGQAASKAGGTVTYTMYPSLAACTAGTGGTAAGTKQVTNGVVPDSDPVTPSSAGTYYWQAVYSGDASNAPASSTCSSEVLVVGTTVPSLSTSLSTSSLTVGGSTHDSATLTGATSNAGGTVTYTVYPNSSCSGGGQPAGTVAVSGGTVPISNTIQFNTAGTYYWQASYSGDANNGAATSPCSSEVLVVNATKPSLSTSLSASSLTVGGSTHDSATLTGATSNAGGTVTYTVYPNSSCSGGGQPAGTVAVSGGTVPVSNAIQFNTAGTYYWQASYSGDTNNSPATSPCTSEVLVVGSASPSIATTLSASTITAGGSVHDSASLSGATSNAGGTVTYTVYTNASCNAGAQSAGTVNVSGGSVPDSNAVPFTSPGTYYWQASYSGDTNNSPATSTCTSEVLTVNSPPAPQNPAITITKNPKTQAILTGGTATFTITVTNTGNVTLTNVTVDDPMSTACDRAVGTLAPGQSTTYTCKATNVRHGFHNVATAAGTPPSGSPVSATDSADVTVSAPFTPPPPAQHPSIAIVKSPKNQTLKTKVVRSTQSTGAVTTTVSYGTAHFTIKVTNTGDVTLHDVTVVDPIAPLCSKSLGTVAKGASRSYTCSLAAVTHSLTNVATVSGISPKGKRVTDSDHAHVSVGVVTTATVTGNAAKHTKAGATSPASKSSGPSFTASGSGPQFTG